MAKFNGGVSSGSKRKKVTCIGNGKNSRIRKANQKRTGKKVSRGQGR